MPNGAIYYCAIASEVHFRLRKLHKLATDGRPYDELRGYYNSSATQGEDLQFTRCKPQFTKPQVLIHDGVAVNSRP